MVTVQGNDDVTRMIETLDSLSLSLSSSCCERYKRENRAGTLSADSFPSPDRQSRFRWFNFRAEYLRINVDTRQSECLINKDVEYGPAISRGNRRLISLHSRSPFPFIPLFPLVPATAERFLEVIPLGVRVAVKYYKYTREWQPLMFGH